MGLSTVSVREPGLAHQNGESAKMSIEQPGCSLGLLGTMQYRRPSFPFLVHSGNANLAWPDRDLRFEVAN